jgi:hypothetical protein
METLMEPKTHTAVSYKAEDIKQKTIKGALRVAGYAMSNGYLLKVDGTTTEIDLAAIAHFFGKTIESDIVLTSKKTKKKLLNKLNSLDKGITLKKANTLLHFLNTKVSTVEVKPSYKFTVSEREAKIKDARAIWVTLRDSAEAALKEYKETKGDFYKAKKG